MTSPLSTVAAARAFVPEVISSLPGGDDMARRRGQNKGHLKEKSGSWIGHWREDVMLADGTLGRVKVARKIAPSRGRDALTKKQAQRLFQESVLAKLDQATLYPQSLITVQDFVRTKFEPEVVWTLKPAGKKHYNYILKHVAQAIGPKRMRDVTGAEVQKVIRGKIDAGFSTQTAAHIKNAISAVFRHAKLTGYFVGENPASLFRIPAMARRPRIALSFEQAKRVLEALPGQDSGRYPAFEMAFLSIITSMNVAEMCGLRWKRVNLTDGFITVDGEVIPPRSVAVRENFYCGQYCSVKTGRRNRFVPLPASAVAIFSQLRRRPKFTGPGDPVFSNRNGRPVDEHNIREDVLAPVGEKFGIKLSWHVFRRTYATLAEEIGMALSDRMAGMGHGSALMTMHYTVADMDRRRDGLQAIASRLLTNAGGVQ